MATDAVEGTLLQQTELLERAVSSCEKLKRENTALKGKLQERNMSFKFSMDLKPTKFSGNQSENADTWMNKFLTHCELNGIEATKYAKLLPLMLADRSPAEIWFQRLDENTKNDWDQLKTGFLARFTSQTPSWLNIAELNGITMNANDTIESYIHRMQLQREKTVVSDDSFLSSFINGLRADIRTFVMVANPKSLAEAEERARLAEKMAAQTLGVATLAPGATTMPSAAGTDLATPIQHLTAAIERLETRVNDKNEDLLKSVTAAVQYQGQASRGGYRGNWRGRSRGRGGVYQNRRDDGRPFCGNCLRIGHTTQSCYAEKRCYLCRQTTHLQRNCPTLASDMQYSTTGHDNQQYPTNH